MKKYGLVLSFVLALALVLPLTVSAALPGTGWQTSYQVMNIGSTDGIFSMQAFPLTGDATAAIPSANFTFSPYEALSYSPGKATTYPAGPDINFSSPLPAGFQGSVVVAANVPVASAVTLANTGVTGGTSRSRYAAISAANLAKEILFPVVKHNYTGQTTTFYIQAAGESASVTMTYSMNNGSTYTQTQTIDANKTFIFDPQSAGVPSTSCGNDGNISPCFGAAKAVSTTGNIAGVIVESPHATSPAPFVLSTRGLTAADLGSKLYAPGVKNAYIGANAGLTVMNTAASGNALVNYTLTVNNVQAGSPAAVAGVVPGQTFTGQVEVAPGKSFIIGPYTTNMGGMPAGTYASIVVESIADGSHEVKQLAGTVNEAKNASIVGGKAKAVYFSFNPANATGNLACPVVKENVYNQTGGMTVVNLGNSPATLKFDYVVYGSTTYTFWTSQPVQPGAGVSTNSVSLNPGGRFTNDGSWAFSELAGKTFSVRVYSDSSTPIVALSQEADKSFTNDIRNYECINY